VKKHDDLTGLLYPPMEQPLARRLKLKNLKHPIWTENKAKLIARYLYYFVMVTKHGAYLDLFAGPQRTNKLDAWAAKLVLEAQPRNFYLRHHYLIEIDKEKIPLLEQLRDEYRDSKRRINITVCQGDCNTIIPALLSTKPIPDREATFCLLDQRTFECHWATLACLANYKNGNKIELFYFLPPELVVAARCEQNQEHRATPRVVGT
jgi:three-Cys-motif partner protein